jgi:hypothetical protein
MNKQEHINFVKQGKKGIVILAISFIIALVIVISFVA